MIKYKFIDPCAIINYNYNGAKLIMALSESVETSLKEAEASLRNALSYAARQERPLVCKTISNIIMEIDHLSKFDDLIDKLESRANNHKGSWGPFSE